MKISIITATYNCASTLEYALASIQSQDYRYVEHIVIDGGSTDGTLEILDKHSKGISVIVSEPDQGIYDALNKGMDYSTGDYVGILHADDFYSDPTCLSKVVDCITSTGSESLYADLEYVSSLDVSSTVRSWVSGEFKASRFLRGWMPPHPTFFIKRELVKKYGGYRLDLGSAADYEFMLRYLYKFRISTAYLPVVFAKMRTGGTSNVTLKNRLKANRMDAKAWRVNGLRPWPITRYLKPLSKLSQWLR